MDYLTTSKFLLGRNMETFAKYTERTAFEKPLSSWVAYAVRVLHSEREQFEYNPEELEPSPIQQEYAPVIFAQDTVAHVISLDMMSGKEDRENMLRARALGKGVLTAPLDLIKSNRHGVILTFISWSMMDPWVTIDFYSLELQGLQNLKDLAIELKVEEDVEFYKNVTYRELV